MRKQDTKKPSSRVEKTKKFLRKYQGLLKNAPLPPDIDIKQIRESRLAEKYDLKSISRHLETS